LSCGPPENLAISLGATPSLTEKSVIGFVGQPDEIVKRFRPLRPLFHSSKTASKREMMMQATNAACSIEQVQ